VRIDGRADIRAVAAICLRRIIRGASHDGSHCRDWWRKAPLITKLTQVIGLPGSS
jgi:hypothetical protein